MLAVSDRDLVRAGPPPRAGQLMLATGDRASGITAASVALKADLLLIGRSRSSDEIARVHSLPFTLLCDVDKKTAIAYGVLKEKNMYGKKVMGIARTTFLIGGDGKIEKIFSNVKPEGHAEEVLAAFEV